MKYILRIVIVICIVFTSINVSGQGWTVTPGAYSNTGTITAVVYHGTNEVTTGTLGAFVGETCRGIVDALYFEPLDRTYFIITCYSNAASGETLTFRYFDPSDGTIYNISETVGFVSDMVVGDIFDPLQLHTVPLIYNVTGGGSYCDGGLPVGLDDSEIGVTYTLLKNSVAQIPTIEGTGSALSFGNQLDGTYTVSGNNSGGTISMSGSAVIIENPSGAAGVTITAVPAGAICEGTSVTFTAMPTNGGTTPAYIWMNGGIPIPGATNSTYTSSTLIDGDVITVEMTSSATCATGSPVTSAGTTMTVNPLLPASVSIAAVPSGEICAGTSVTFTATPTNGGSSPVYQWKLNGSDVGTNSAVYTTTTLINGNTITVEMTSDAVCATGNPATSGGITMTVNTVPTVTSASVTPTSVCGSGTVTFSATASSGTIKWYTAITGGTEVMVLNPTISSSTTYYAEAISPQSCISAARTPVTATVNAIPDAPTGTSTQTFCSVTSPTVANLTATGTTIQWYSASTGGSPLVTSAALASGHYYASQTVNGCESTSRFDVTVTVNTTPSAPTGTATQSFCSATSPTVASLTASGTAILWYAASTGGTPLASSTSILNGIHYYASQTVNGCESISRIDVTVTINTTPAAPTGTAAQSLCSATSPTVASLTATGTAIQWYSASTGGTPLATLTSILNGIHYYASQTVNGCESTARFDVTVTVNTTPGAPAGTAAQSFCSATSPTVASLTATGTTILWYAASTGGSPLATSAALASGHYYASQTVNGCESTSRFDVTVTVNTTPAAPTGTAAQSFCSATSPTVASLTATGTAIQWYSASTGGSPLATSAVLATGHYYASQTVNGCESTARFDVTVTVNTTPAAPTGSAAQSFCSATSPTVASLTASGTAILWYAASTGGSPLATSVALASGHYYASQTVNGCESTARFDVTATVNTTPAAPTGTAAQSFCSATSPTVANLTASGTAIKWYAASTGGTPLATSTSILNGIHYYASQTVNGCESTSRFDVTVTVNTTPAAPTGSAAQSFCSATSPTVANLTASGTAIKWYAASTGGSPLVTSAALASGHYYASQTVNGCESTARFDVTVTVNTTPGAPTGTAAQSFCSATSPTVANLTASGTAIKWYAASTGGTALATSTSILNGIHYYASQTVNGCESTARFDVTATVNTTPAAPTGTAAQIFCSATSPTVANLTASGTAIKWYAASTGGTALATSTSILNGIHYYASQTVNGCESSSRFDVTVTVNTTPGAPTGSAAQSFCSATSPTVANLTASGTAIKWYAASTGGTPLATSTSLVTGIHYYASQTVNGCESTSRFDVTVTINTTPAAPTGTAAQIFCSATSPTVANLTATGTAIQWYAASTGGTPLATSTSLVTGIHYYASQTVNGCESTSRFDVTVTINTTPAAPTGTAAQTFCSIALPRVSDIVITATGTVIWYTAPSGGTVVPATTPLITATTYYASQTISGCESDTRLAVTVTVSDPAPPSGTAAQTFCSIALPRVSDIVITATGTVIWYTAPSGGTVVPATTPLITATTYYASQTISGCESDTRLAVTVTVSDPAPPSGTAAQTFCSIALPRVSDIVITATGTVIWYTAPSGGTVVPATTPLITATTYYASQTISGCESDTRLAVTVTVSDPAPPSGTAAQTFCSIALPKVSDIVITATGTVIWYTASSGGTVVPTTTPLITATTYYASQTISGCESDTRLAVTVAVSDPAPPSGTAAQTFCSIALPMVSDISISATGTVIWYTAPSGGTVVPATTSLITATTYYASQTISGCESDTRLAVTVTVSDPAPPSGTAAQTFCSIALPRVSDIAITATGTVIWYTAPSGGTVVPATTSLITATTYYASQTISGCESDTRLAVTVTVSDPAPPSGTAAQTFCSIALPRVSDIAITATGTVIWYTAPSGGIVVPATTSLITATTYYASQTISGCESDTRLAVTVTVSDPAPPSGTAAQSFCSATSPTVASLTATGTAIKWYSASTGGSPLATSAALASGHYYASQTVSGCESDLRFDVTVTINPTPSVLNQTTSMVTGTSFTVTPAGVPLNTTYTWTTPSYTGGVEGGSAQLTGQSNISGSLTIPTGTGTAIYTVTPTAGSCIGATFLVTVTVSSSCTPVTIGTQPVSTSMCTTSGNASFTVVPGGTAPFTYQWQYNNSSTWGNVVNGTPAGALYTNSTTATLNITGITSAGSPQYRCIVTNCISSSATTNSVTLTVNTTPAAPTGTAAQSFCSAVSPTVASLTATGTAIQWYSASTGGSPLATSAALASGHYYASQTVGVCESTSRFDVTVTVNTTPSAPTGTAAQIFCSATSPTVASLTATGTAIQWYSASTGGTPLATLTSILNGIHYYASQTVNGCESTARFDVTVTVNTTPGAPAGTAAQSFCSATSPTVASLTATGTTILWYAASTGGSPLATSAALASGHYYASQTVNGCESTSRFDVTVTVNTTPAAPTGTSTQTFCSVTSPTVANLTATGTAIQWYSASTGGSPLATSAALASGHYYASQTVNGCESTSRFDVTVTVNTTPSAPTGTAAQSFCSATSPTVANLTATGTAIKWYAASTGGTPLATSTSILNGIHYYASQTVNGCESTSRFDVTVTVNTTPAAPTGTAAQSFCSATSPTVASLTATGTSILWYSASTGGSPLVTSAALASGHYFASQTVNGCESTSRFDVIVTVNPTPSVLDQTTSMVTGTSFTVTPAGVPAGTTYTWTAPSYTGGVSGGSAQSTGQSNISGSLIIPTGTGTAIYTVTPKAGSCTGTTFLVTVTVSSSCAPVTIGTQPLNASICTTTGNASFTVVPGGTAPFTYQWEYNDGGSWESVANGTPAGASYTNVSTATLNVTGITSAGTPQYRCHITNCSGATFANSNVVTLTVNATPAAPVVGTRTQPTCALATGSVILNGLPAGTWTINPGSINGSTASTTISGLATGTYTYTVTNSLGCTSLFSANIVINAQPTAPTAPVASVTQQPTCAVSTGTITVTSPASGTGYEYSTGGAYQSGTTFTGLAAGNYNVTVRRTSDNTCISPATILTINAQPPTPNITDQTTSIISEGTFIVTPGGVPLGTTYIWTTPSYTGGVTGGSAQTSPQSNITGSLNIPSGTGTAVYVVTPTAGSCIGATFTVTVTVTSSCIPVTAETQPLNTDMCATSGTSTFSVVAAGTGPFTYQWQYYNGSTWNSVTNGLPAGASYSNSTSAILTVSGTTTAGDYQYRCYITNCNGSKNATSNPATLTVNALPAAPSPGTITQPTCTLPTGTVVLDGLPAGSWTINPGDITGSTASTSISGLVPATYTFTVTNSIGCTSFASSDVVIQPEPGKPNAPVAGTITQPTCNLATGSVILTGLLAGSWTINPGSISGSGTSTTISGLAAGTYNYTVTNSIGCTSVLSSNIVINTQPITPTLVITNPSAVCSPSTVNLTTSAVTAGSTSGLTYTYWINTSATVTYATPAAAVAGTYYIKGTTTAGCYDIKPVTAIVNPLPAANAGTGGSECDLDFTFSAVPDIGTGTWSLTGGPGTATATFAPDANTATATVTVSEFGTYTFTWTEVSNGCSNSSPITVNFIQKPVANAGSGGISCGLVYTLSAVPGIGTGTWTQTSGSGTATFTPDENTPDASATVSLYGTYTFTWTEVNGSCSDSAPVNVTFVNVPPANAGTDESVCDLSFGLHALPGTGAGPGTWTQVSGPGNAAFSPDPNDPDASVTVDQAGTYDFSWTEITNTCESTDIVSIIFRSLPAVSAGNDTTICISENIQLQGEGIGSFLWEPAVMIIDPALQNPVALPLSTTTFKLNLTDQFGCKNSDEVVVTVKDIPVAYAGPDQVLKYRFGTTLTATEPRPDEEGTWSVISGTGEFSAATGAITELTGLSLGENIILWTVTNGVCPASNDYASIVVNDLVIPTLITPNMDGKNDYFVLIGIESLGKTELVIFDRRGAQVYKNTDYDNSWHGVDYNEKPLLDDTYYFVIRSESGKSFSGYIVVRR